MIFIYNCYGGTHTSSLASAIHLGKLPEDRLPTREEILNTEYFNKLNYKDMGRFIYRGVDSGGNKVYSLGRGWSSVLLPCLKNFLELLHEECGLNEKIVLSNMSPTVPPVMTVGGFVSRAMGINFIGEPLLVIGSRQAYQRITEIVKETKDTAKRMKETVVMLENKVPHPAKA